MDGPDIKLDMEQRARAVALEPQVIEEPEWACAAIIWQRDELAALRARAAELKKERDMAKRLMRAREARINAIRQILDQNKGDDLVRVEARHFCDCPYNEIDVYAARASAAAQDVSEINPYFVVDAVDTGATARSAIDAAMAQGERTNGD